MHSARTAIMVKMTAEQAIKIMIAPPPGDDAARPATAEAASCSCHSAVAGTVACIRGLTVRETAQAQK